MTINIWFHKIFGWPFKITVVLQRHDRAFTGSGNIWFGSFLRSVLFSQLFCTLYKTAVHCIKQGFLDPWVFWTRFSGVQNGIFEVDSVYVLGSTFFQRTEVYVSLQVLLRKRTLSNLVIPANVTILTIVKCVHCYFCFTLRLRRRWGRCASKRIVTFKCIWHKYGEIIVWCNRTRKFLLLNQGKLPEIVHKIPVYSSALRNKIFVRTWIFLST